jgi:hypothetical protein
MRPPLAIALVTAMLFLMAGLLVGNKWRVEPAPVLIENVSNDTGIATYQPLATALQELIIDHLSASGMKVISPRLAADERGGKGFMRLRSRLIIWNGISTLSMQATDKMGVVAWAAMAVAPPDGLAAATISKLELFQQASRSRSRGPDSLRRR